MSSVCPSESQKEGEKAEKGLYERIKQKLSRLLQGSFELVKFRLRAAASYKGPQGQLSQRGPQKELYPGSSSKPVGSSDVRNLGAPKPDRKQDSPRQREGSAESKKIRIAVSRVGESRSGHHEKTERRMADTSI